MAKCGSLLFSFSVLILMFNVNIPAKALDEDREVHIVYMGSLPQGEYSLSSLTSSHISMLEQVMERSVASNYLLRSYGRSFNGFSANLTAKEREKLARMKVGSVFPSTNLKLHTTRSWDFMGFPETVHRKPTAESDIIVGVIDTGIWPESSSFDDKGFGDPPKKWKGACEGGKDFKCNRKDTCNFEYYKYQNVQYYRKIIGARYYNIASPGTMSARDEEGHGSHTASIAAGNNVKGASFYGFAEGTARGGVPSARIAVYKACHPEMGCSSADLLAAFDDAIADGVDVITISIGSDPLESLDGDVISLGSFHAMEKGILTVQSAGNGGFYGLFSRAPWVLTVGASSIDRKFIGKVRLGDGKTLAGRSVNSFTLNGTMLPLLYGKDVSSCPESSSRFCIRGCIDADRVKGKIVLCDYMEGVSEAYRVGALGAIAQNELVDASLVVPLPASGLNDTDFHLVQQYHNSTKNPLVSILKSETIKDLSAPKVALYSSCGPNILISEIMKPDVTAPGVDILAAYSPIASPTDGPLDNRKVKYNVLSGTSVACPHVAGLAAYIKTFHPDWSPSAIKSAIMTTAMPMNLTASPKGEFGYGSGHINPTKALNPGLVYDADREDYIRLLCAAGIDQGALEHITRDNSTCTEELSKEPLAMNFNYPAITFPVSPTAAYSKKITRTVTNVGKANSTYMAKIMQNRSFNVTVQPEILSFKSLHEKKSFVVTVVGQPLGDIGSYPGLVSASFEWSDGIHVVRSPVVVFPLLT